MSSSPMAPEDARVRRSTPWPTAFRSGRRRVALVVLLPLVGLAIHAATAGAGDPAAVTTSPWWTWPVLLLGALLGAATLATYVPSAGPLWRIDVGCSPCAVVAGLTVVASLVARASGPTDGAMALASLVLLAAGLRQRVTDSGSCALPAAP